MCRKGTKDLTTCPGSNGIPLQKVTDLLSSAATVKSMGLDEHTHWVHPRVLRELVQELAKPISIVYQQSWLTGEVPADRK